MNFKEVIGHDAIINSLMRMIEQREIGHLFLFSGNSGVGKKYIANIFAKALLCPSKVERPCGNCPSCYKFSNHTHPDLFYVKPENNLIRKETISNLIENANVRPYESELKVFIIDHADLMNKEAQNAFLKTLEEPPSYLKIILLSSNPKRLLPTILSRCQLYKFFPLDNFKIIEYLSKNYNINGEKASFIADFSKGSIGRAVKLIEDENFNAIRDKSLNILDNVIKGGMASFVNNQEFFENNKDYMNTIVEIYELWASDLYRYTLLKEDAQIINRDKIDILKTQSFLSLNNIDKILNSINDFSKKLEGNSNFMLNLELMFLNILEECN
ncbi:MAG: DNA polymerase III subunit delta' [Tissierellia bacterium]|nr:DNA polymerase III subunit delta' [Tissierellia bacterium]